MEEVRQDVVEPVLAGVSATVSEARVVDFVPEVAVSEVLAGALVSAGSEQLRIPVRRGAFFFVRKSGSRSV